MPPKRPGHSGGRASASSSGATSANPSSMNSGATEGNGSGSPSSPTASQMREQQLQQQQVYQHQLQLIRLAQQQQRPGFPVTEVIRTGFMFIVALVAMYLVFKDYGWAMTTAFTTLLYMCGLFRFLSVLARWLFQTVDGVSFNDALRRADIMTEPITKKTTHAGENATLVFGCSCMQGWRRTMEDAHTILTFDDGGFFAVYDGHSGSGTSKFCGPNLYQFVADTAAFKDKNYTTALYDGFIAIDRHLLEKHRIDRSGCTAVVLFVKGDELYCANAGDSRCVLCRDGEPFPLSVDHKPYLPTEQSRIERAGGYVWGRRVNGILALSRAIGDFGFKQNKQVSWDQQAVTSAPEVRTTRLNRDKDEFAVVACDGIWDVMTNEQVIEFVRARLQQRVPLGHICELLMEACLSPQPFGLGCDNMSVIIVQFKRTTQSVPASPVSAGVTGESGEQASPSGAGGEAVAAASPPGSPKGSAAPSAASPPGDDSPLTAKTTAARRANASSPAPDSHPTSPLPKLATAISASAGKSTTVAVSPESTPLTADKPQQEGDEMSESLSGRKDTPITTATAEADSLHASSAPHGDNHDDHNGHRSSSSAAATSGSPAVSHVEPLHAEEEHSYVNREPSVGSDLSTPNGEPTARPAASPPASASPPMRGSAAPSGDGRKLRSAPPARPATHSGSELEQLKHAVSNGLQ